MEISTAMMQHILRLTEGYTDLLNELKEVKAAFVCMVVKERL